MDREEKIEALLQHGKGRGPESKLSHAARSLSLENPTCGDSATFSVIVENGKIQDIRYESKGCFLCKTSTSVLGSVLKEMTIEEANQCVAEFRKRFVEGKELEDLPGDLPLLSGFESYPARVKCVLLPFEVVTELIKSLY